MKNKINVFKLFGTSLTLFFFALGMMFSPSWAETLIDCASPPPYEAPPYIELPAETPPPSKLIDKKDGTLADPDSGLLWTQKDSYADLNKCLTWPEALSYVEGLKTAGYSDWRMPSIAELATIYDRSRENIMAWDHDPNYPLALDKKFADGAAYWYWSNECGKTELTKCCAKSLYFASAGNISLRQFDQCNNGGVRAVRKIK